MKTQFIKSLVVFIPLWLILSLLFYGIDNVLLKAIAFGFIGSLSVFFVPKVFKKNKKR